MFSGIKHSRSVKNYPRNNPIMASVRMLLENFTVFITKCSRVDNSIPWKASWPVTIFVQTSSIAASTVLKNVTWEPCKSSFYARPAWNEQRTAEAYDVAIQALAKCFVGKKKRNISLKPNLWLTKFWRTSKLSSTTLRCQGKLTELYRATWYFFLSSTILKSCSFSKSCLDRKKCVPVSTSTNQWKKSFVWTHSQENFLMQTSKSDSGGRENLSMKTCSYVRGFTLYASLTDIGDEDRTV